MKEDGKEKYYYPLSESQGEQALDISSHKVAAAIKSPVWIKPKHQNWQQVYSLVTKGTSSFAFNKKNGTLYFVSRDSLYQLSFKNMEATGIKLAKGHGSLPAGNQSVFDIAANKLYNFYIDEKQVSSYDPVARTWNVNFSPKALTIFWHANKFLSWQRSRKKYPRENSTDRMGSGRMGICRYKHRSPNVRFPCTSLFQPFTARWLCCMTNLLFTMEKVLTSIGATLPNETA